MRRPYWRVALILFAVLCVAYSTAAPASQRNATEKPHLTPIPCSKPGPWRVAMDARNVYWTDFGSGIVLKAPISGGETKVLASGQQGPCGIAIDDKSVYWSNNQGGTIMEVSVGGGPTAVLASGQDHPTSIGVNKDKIYYTIGTSGVGKIGLRGHVGINAASNSDVDSSGGTVHCDLCADYCTRTVCDLNSCREEQYLCGWHSCNCRPGS